MIRASVITQHGILVSHLVFVQDLSIFSLFSSLQTLFLSRILALIGSSRYHYISASCANLYNILSLLRKRMKRPVRFKRTIN